MKTLLITLLVATALFARAQVSVNMTGTPADSSAMLDVSSTSKGMLVPRMTLAQRNLIIKPATGLMIYQTNNTPGFYYNSGTPTAPAWALVGGTTGQWLTNGTSLYYNAGNVGIGISTPTTKLEVAGGDALLNGLTVGKGGGSVSDNTAAGYQALYSNTTGNGNTASGYGTLYSNTEGNENTATGSQALYSNTEGT